MTTSPPPPLPSGETDDTMPLTEHDFAHWVRKAKQLIRQPGGMAPGMVIQILIREVRALRAERDTLAGQVARLEAEIAERDAVIVALRCYVDEHIWTQIVGVALRAALAGADGQEATGSGQRPPE
jgi:hypothetical protein